VTGDRRSRLARLWDVVRRQLRHGASIVRNFHYLKRQRGFRKAFVRANRAARTRRPA
jgi:hypothetical protein